MTCREVEEQEILERYVLDRLTESERDAFEQHYFECDACFAQLQAGLAVQEDLRQHSVRKKARGAFLRHIRIWVPAFAALVLIFLFAISRYRTSTRPMQPTSSAMVTTPPVSMAPPSPMALSLDELAHVEAPRYSKVVFRGVEDAADTIFSEAMRHYSKHDYAGAIPGLRAAVKASPRTARFNFYLGACYLLSNQTDSAIASFRKVVSLNDPAFSEMAHFYLAKAYLRNHDVSNAEKELRATVNLGGSRAAEASEILRQLC